MKDPKIPKEPTIRIRKLPGGNLVDFIAKSFGEGLRDGYNCGSA